MFNGLTGIGRLMERRARMQRYRATQEALSMLTEADLADVGMKRYQLDHVARTRALK